MSRPNPKSRARDMAISLAVLLLPLALILWFFTQDPAPKIEAIDMAPHLARAEAESPYPVLRATNLPEGWTPVRAAWAKDGSQWIDGEPAIGNTWMAGYLSPEGIYFGIEQRDRSAADVIQRVTREGKAGEQTIEAAGMTWQAYESKDGRTMSLVARNGDQVAVLAADTNLAALEAFVGTLAAN